MTVVMGLDLSLRAAAAVVVPADWDGDWKRVHSKVIGEALSNEATLAERAMRNWSLSKQLSCFAINHHVTDVFIEGYAFGKGGRSDSVHKLAELGGVVKLELVLQNRNIHIAHMGTARKLLLGKCPRQGAKMAVFDAFVAAGKRFESLDESDAMACANYGLAELGGWFFGREEAA